MFTFDKNKFIMSKEKKEQTEIISLRVPKKLKAKIKKKYGRKLSEKVVPYLEYICG